MKENFFFNPEKKFDIYRQAKSRFSFITDTVEDKILYIYDFISDAINYFRCLSDKDDKFGVLDILRAFTYSPRDQERIAGHSI